MAAAEALACIALGEVAGAEQATAVACQNVSVRFVSDRRASGASREFRGCGDAYVDISLDPLAVLLSHRFSSHRADRSSPERRAETAQKMLWGK